MKDIAIRAEKLGKRYRIGQYVGYRTLRESVIDAVSVPFRNMTSALGGQIVTEKPPSDTTIWALKGVSFEIKQGEAVGIIGRNGAGKSTLLKVLSRITEPSEGYAEVRGHVGSLLEVGTGIHPELTGRENIYLSGVILGMKKAEIDRKFDEIVDFSGIEKHLDTPVKRYSDGMRVRLVFSVAAHLEPQVLLIDEVLAVGDAEFQKKCLGKMEDVTKGGRTVLFVSHNMGAITELCERAILLDQGQIVSSGEAKRVVSEYLQSFSNKLGSVEITESDSDKEVSLKRAAILNQKGAVDANADFSLPFFVSVEFEVKKPVRQLSLWIRLVNEYGIRVLFSWVDFQKTYQPGVYHAMGKMPGELLTPGRYYLDVGAEHYRVQKYHYAISCLAFDVINIGVEYDPSLPGWGVIYPKIPWEVGRQDQNHETPQR